MDQSELCFTEPRKPVSDPVRTAALGLLQTLEQVRKQIERRVDWDTLEPRVTRLVARAEAGAKLLSSTGGEGDCCDAAPCWPGTLMETLTEVSVGAAVAAEAGQWRWAWSTDAVLARLRRMRGDLKRAFAAVEDAAPKPAIESITVTEEQTLAPSTPSQTSPRRQGLWRVDSEAGSAAEQAAAAEWGDASTVDESASLPTLVTSSFPQGTVKELASGLRLRPIRVGTVSLEP